MKYKDVTILGKGIYTIPEAARLARVSGARMNRWISGYERAGVSYPPLWESELHFEDDEPPSSISFADLMEAKVIAAFYIHGVQIQTVRKAIEIAREFFRLERPFSSEIFQTDGKRIFLELGDTVSGDEGLLDVVTNQRTFREIVSPTFKNIDFEESTAVRWWPLGKNNPVVVDPSRSLGRPIDNSTGVPIDSLVDALGIKDNSKPSKQDFQYVSRLFDVEVSNVIAAVEFSKLYAA